MTCYKLTNLALSLKGQIIGYFKTGFLRNNKKIAKLFKSAKNLIFNETVFMMISGQNQPSISDFMDPQK